MLGARGDLDVLRAALECDNERVRDRAVTDLYKAGDLEPLRAYADTYGKDPERAETVRRARFLVDKGPPEKQTP